MAADKTSFGKPSSSERRSSVGETVVDRQTPAAAPLEDTAYHSTPHSHVYSTISSTASGACFGVLQRFAPAEVIDRMAEDWFEVTHAIAPILFRRRYLRRLRSGVADVDPTFCGLVISACAATLSTLPRRDYSPVTLTRCITFIEENRLLPCGVAQPNYTVDWCVAMYNMGVAIAALSPKAFHEMRSFHAISQSTAGVRYLAYYCMAELDLVEQQILKRLIWLLFAASE